MSRKDLAGYRGGGPGVAVEHSPTAGDRSTPTSAMGSPGERKISSTRQPHPGLAISEANESSFASPTRLPSWSPGGKKILSTGRPDRPSSQSPAQPKSPHQTPAADPITSQNSRRRPVSRIAEGDRRQPAAEGRPLLRAPPRTPSKKGSAANSPRKTGQRPPPKILSNSSRSERAEGSTSRPDRT